MVPKSSQTDDIEQLLALAEKKKEVKTKDNPEIDRFIQECSIASGTQKVPSYIVYYRYTMWKQTRCIPRRKFLNYFKTKFTKTQTSDGIGYLLNPKGFDLSPVYFFKARAQLRHEKDQKTKKKQR